jgi:hypothetical protein
MATANKFPPDRSAASSSLITLDESTRVERGGSSNTRHTDKLVPSGFEVIEAGIDTARAIFGLNREYRGPQFGQSKGLRWQFYPHLGRVAVEGHPTPGELAPDEALADWVEFGQRTVGLGHFLGFTRLDATATVAFEDPAQGAALLRSLAAVRLPWVKPAVYGNPPETVYWLDRRGSGRKLCRAYDKGIESDSAGRGALIRLEEQAKFKTDRRPGLPHACGQVIYERRFAPALESSATLQVMGHEVALDALTARLRDGALTDLQFDSLTGFVYREARAIPQHPKTALRRRRQLRELGIALADQDSDSAPLDLAAVVGATITSKEWR